MHKKSENISAKFRDEGNGDLDRIMTASFILQSSNISVALTQLGDGMSGRTIGSRMFTKHDATQ
jgi:hypothetical protein